MAFHGSPLLPSLRIDQHDALQRHPDPIQNLDSADSRNSLSSGLTKHVSSSSWRTSSSTAYEPIHVRSDFTERKPSKQASSVRTSAGSWILEIFAVVISAGAIASIVALLYRENGKPLSAWKLAITLNTIVAALGTLARTTLAFALSACVGQQKWNWLRRKPDSLIAWERFDEASRGPWGGTRLLIWLRARHWAVLGALVTVGAIAFDPFLQAAISTRGQLDSIPANENADATIGQSFRINSGLIEQLDGAAIRDMATGLVYKTSIGGRADFGFISSVYSGFQNTSNFRNDAIGTRCTTGNCTWPAYTSAAVCSSCKDVSSHLNRRQFYGKNGTNIPTINSPYEGDFIKFELPYANMRNYVGLANDESDKAMLPRSTFMTANTTIDANRTIAFQQIETLLMAFTIIRAPEDWLEFRIKWEEATPIATECALYLCANAYQSKSENSVVTGQLLGTWAEKVPGSFGVDTNAWNFDDSNNWNFEGGAQAWVDSLGSRLYDARIDRMDLQLLIPPEQSKHLPPDVRREFNVSHAFIFSAIDFLLGYTKEQTIQTKPADTNGQADETWDMLAVPLWKTSQPAVLDALWNSTNLTTTFENVARSLTTQIRNSSPDRHQGELQKWVLHVHVDWAYLAYPVFMLVAGIVYVILTIIESSRLRMPVWKESALPTLLHGFDDETQRLLRGDGQDAQRRLIVRFEHDEKDCLRLLAQY
ncbi:hypothetical protein OPT61_g4167 [Boeremia exigua]|uniref:Uncharacterized protein n=1 Tax=Boeremia exigua TaxID=749465 RepID=A0ACC2IF25_9PLEO|nr:hypothetical protein OPT61_g4167 [Boeremia exigua]